MLKYLVLKTYKDTHDTLTAEDVVQFTRERAGNINAAQPGTLLPYSGPVKPGVLLPVKKPRRRHDTN